MLRRIPLTLLSLTLLYLTPWSVSARPGRRPLSYVANGNNNLNNHDDRYTLNLTVAGTVINVILDTGSTDLWVSLSQGLSGQVNESGTSAELRYGDGSTFVNGSVELGLVEIAGHTIPQQAFINVLNSAGLETDLDHGVNGLVGLGFDEPVDDIPTALTKAGYNGTDVGKSDEKYAAVQDAPLLLQYPPNSGAWTVQTDDVAMNGVTIPWISFNETSPKARKTILLDTGKDDQLPCSSRARNSSIPNTKASEDNDVWVVPCRAAINFTTWFAAQEFPIHPLDLTDVSVLLGPDGKNYTVCVGTITNGGSILGPESGWDAIYGDSAMRNFYTVFSFGNDTTPPHVQLLSNTDAIEAAQDFATVRAALLASYPAELSPQDAINLFDGPFPTTGSGGTATTPQTTTIPTTSPSEVAGFIAAEGDLASSGNSDSATAKYGPIILGLLGANLLLLLFLTFLGVLNYLRSGRESKGRAVNPVYFPVKFKDTEGTSGPDAPSFERYND
ncbi:aspartic peptidase domain-containing protein [Roridomyces roridus]|uniref:Aspartic peptidase domain-containing protein n=1 Tax=Roridomyces roridus TaxID=1738132 RepID=A0AAD7FUE7_9AGAR|nr:aspartic peptidase domain-containing protein [Roridomyces roridus]